LHHGTYLFGSEGKCYSSHIPSKNNIKAIENFTLNKNDVMHVTYDKKEL
jgi:hypothetical protein